MSNKKMIIIAVAEVLIGATLLASIFAHREASTPRLGNFNQEQIDCSYSKVLDNGRCD